MTGTYKHVEGPTHIDGHIEVVFEKDGQRVYRYLSKKQAAAFESRMGSRNVELTQAEIDDETNPADYRVLEEREKQEGQGG